MRVFLWSMTGAVLSAGLLAGYQCARAGASLVAWDLVLLAALVGAGLTAGAILLTLRHFRKAVGQLGKQLAGLQLGSERIALADPDSELQPLLEPLEILCAAYRKFLKERQAERLKLEQTLDDRDHDLAQTNDYLLRLHKDMQRLKESYKDLYQNAPVMFFSLDPEGKFVSCNETFLKTLGYQREDLTGKSYTRLLPKDDRKVWRKIDSTNPFFWVGEVECHWLRKNGKVMDVVIRTLPILDDDGNFVRSRSAAQDVTVHNKLSRELRQRGDELERANAQLRRTNRELEEFTSVVSHDLKEPLRTIEAYSSTLAREFGAALGPDGFQSINHLVQASRRLGCLIDDLLLLTRAGRRTRSPESFQFNEIVATVRRDLADMLQRRSADLICEGSLPTVVGDPRRITQLLSNLVANGLKYNESSVPRVVIGSGDSPTYGKPSPGFVTLWVRDNGIGIDPEFHEDIFRIFRRLHPSDKYEGTGAGLAICEKIVETHGGRLWVDSTPGQGAIFYFTLPCLLPLAGPRPAVFDKPMPTRERKPAAPLSVKETRRFRETVMSAEKKLPLILLVEDIPEIALLTQKLSQRAGYEVAWVTSGEAAWDYLQAQRPDLVLLDVHLPGMDGVELCRRLRSQPGFAQLPIAFFTQSLHHDEYNRLQESGPCFVLTKDLLVQPETLLRRFREILQGQTQPV